ncbi:MAG TPA: MFS transporter [Actinomycetota bacterium]
MATTFAAHAAITGTVGPWIPRLKADANLDAAGLGLALAAYAVGLVVGTRLAALAFAGAGRATVRIGIPVLGGALALLPLANGLASLASVFAALGLASGLLDVAMNIEAAAVERRAGRRLMSGMHGTWSASMLVGAAIASAGVAAGIPVGVHLALVAALVVIGTVPLLAWLPSSGTDRVVADGTDDRQRRRLPIGRMALLCLIPFAAFLTEGVAAEWSAVFLREAAGAAVGIAGLGVVAFSAGMAVSRFVGDRLATRHGPSTVVRVGTSVGAIALAGALIGGGTVAAIAAFTMLGLGIGPAVPLAFSAAANASTAHGRTVLGLAVTAGYLGSIVGPIAVGFTADGFGFRWAFAIPVGMCVAVALGATALREPEGKIPLPAHHVQDELGASTRSDGRSGPC